MAPRHLTETLRRLACAALLAALAGCANSNSPVGTGSGPHKLPLSRCAGCIVVPNAAQLPA